MVTEYNIRNGTIKWRIPESFKVVSRIFRRSATHCISPYAIVVCVSVCMYAAFVDLMKTVWDRDVVVFKLRGITSNIICKSLSQIWRWRTKGLPWSTQIGCNSAICGDFFHRIVRNDTVQQSWKFEKMRLQIPRWRTKWRPWNTIIGCNSTFITILTSFFH